MNKDNTITKAPKGLAILAMVGPAFVWCGEYIGSGEVILATRVGAILGHSTLWTIVIGIALKACIGLGGARYTACTGEGMIDMFSRMPGKKNWAVWIVLVCMFLVGAMAIGSLASAAGVFAHSLIPLSPFLWGWIITIFAIAVVWSGTFNIIKYIMSVFIFIIIAGVIYVAVHTSPGFIAIIKGVFGFQIPAVPSWALEIEGVSSNPWREILPLIGWAAGGFASQVWYTYWVLGAGYGMARDREYGQPGDVNALKTMTVETADRIKGWCRVVYVDATVAMIIGIVVTSCFMISGAGVLHIEHIAPNGSSVAFELSNVFGKLWGKVGGTLFIIAGCAALVSTIIGGFAGWPRLIADSLRICIPGFGKKFQWSTQFKICASIYFFTNIIITYTLGIKPVFIIKISAILEGLLFTPFQAILVFIGLMWVLPKLLPREAWNILKPHWFLPVGLIVSAIVFGYFCLFQLFPFR